jgi:hypothetical protein
MAGGRACSDRPAVHLSILMTWQAWQESSGLSSNRCEVLWGPRAACGIVGCVRTACELHTPHMLLRICSIVC